MLLWPSRALSEAGGRQVKAMGSAARWRGFTLQLYRLIGCGVCQTPLRYCDAEAIRSSPTVPASRLPRRLSFPRCGEW